jgi:hypothetical protein
MVNVYGLELETRMRQQQAERLAAADRLSKSDWGTRGQAQAGMKWQAGELLLRLGRWMQGEAGSSTSDLAWQ